MRWLLVVGALGLGFAGCEYQPPERNPYGQTDAFGPGEFPYPDEDQGGAEEQHPAEPVQEPNQP